MDKEKNTNNSYLTFRLGKEEFGVHVSQVLNILEMTQITEVPKTPDFMKGVINLRGTVLPVIDTRVKFAMSETEYTSKTCIIVLDLDLDGNPVNIGAIVDEVLSVIEIEAGDIEPPPNLGNQYQSEFIYGMARADHGFIMMLDMEKVISVVELEQLAQNTEEEKINS
ncbi:MAG: chemotaxis protein CheW [Bacteroidales bacterium]